MNSKAMYGGIDEEIKAVLDSPETSFWLKAALSQALQRDCVDAAADATLLSNLLERRCDKMLGRKG
ncbi:hypothetical protein ACTHR6_24765 [Ralstonia holmesii]|uniref:hypothetical protein n=1 Tax=Ralstonia TaxID=48736 RepID=UPI0004687047|nr:hypothetical protein [Ralstonia pickettii]